MATSDMASVQTKAAQETKKATDKLLDYVGTHPNAEIRYKQSDMELNIHSDASYLSAPQARSRVGGHFFLGNKSTSEEPDMHNGSVLSVAAILKNVVSSAAEAKVGGMYVNAREGEVGMGTNEPNTHCHRQFDSAGHRERHNKAAPFESNRHALLLGARQSRAATLHNRVGTR